MDKKEAGYLYKFKLITEYDKFRSSIQKLKKNYPELYSIRVDFFDKVQNSIERKNMQANYNKQASRLDSMLGGFFDLDDEEYDYDEEWFDYEPQDPYVREEPKVGRNDPCICGSGKKYKKCCGK